ncbi:MAG: DUF4124 domain-containing protein [Moraxellaceae bacterium]|nr:DUF4124 domain-containing protein [Moraxellaceae bacterium]
MKAKKNGWQSGVLTLSVLLPALALAQPIYRHGDANGNPVFTDDPRGVTTPVELGEGTTVSGENLRQRLPYAVPAPSGKGREHPQVMARQQQQQACAKLRDALLSSRPGSALRTELNDRFDRECVLPGKW